MLNKNDPLIAAVQKVMQTNQAERDAVRVVNEKFGVVDRRALPRERQHEWDSAYQSLLKESDDMGPTKKKESAKMYKHKTSGKEMKSVKHPGNDWEVMKEALHPNQQKLDVHEPEKDELTKHDFKMLRAKKKTMEEAKKMKGDDPCWKGYEMIGMKNKGGKEVPNCVPVKEEGVPGKAIRGDVVTGGSSVTSVAPKEKSVQPSDQSELKKKIQGIMKEANLEEKAPPGREDQVKALKKKFPKGSGSPFAIAWASYKKKKKLEEGFNNRHDLSVTASVEGQVVADQLNEASINPILMQKTQNRYKQLAANSKITNSIKAREPKEAPSSFTNRVKQGANEVGAGLAAFTNNALMGKEVAAAGDYLAKNYIGKPLGLSKGTTWAKEYGQEQEKEARAKLNNPTGYKIGDVAGDAANVASAAGLVKSGVKYGVKKLIKSKVDDLAKSAPKTSVPSVAQGSGQANRLAANVRPNEGPWGVTPPAAQSASKLKMPPGGFAANLQRARQQAQTGRAGVNTAQATQAATRAASARQSSQALGGLSKTANATNALRAKQSSQALGGLSKTANATNALRAKQSSQALGGFGRAASSLGNLVRKYPKLSAGAAAGAAMTGFAATQVGNKPPSTQADTGPEKIKTSTQTTTTTPDYDKMSFKQAFSAARKQAGGAGGKFKYKGKEYQTNVQGTGTAAKPQEKYQAASKLKTVTPPSETKTTTSVVGGQGIAGVPGSSAKPAPTSTPKPNMSGGSGDYRVAAKTPTSPMASQGSSGATQSKILPQRPTTTQTMSQNAAIGSMQPRSGQQGMTVTQRRDSNYNSGVRGK